MKRSDTLFQFKELRFHCSFNQRIGTFDCCVTSLKIAEIVRPARLTVLVVVVVVLNLLIYLLKLAWV